MLQPTIYIPSRLTKLLAMDPDPPTRAGRAGVIPTIGPCLLARFLPSPAMRLCG
jgi:hypothetical protein